MSASVSSVKSAEHWLHQGMNKIDSHLNQQECEESFEKQCSITFKQQAYNETVRKCYRPVEKVCSGQGPEVCRTVYEASCSTKYVGVSQKQYKNSQLIFSDMLRSCQVSSCLTLSVRSCLWRSAELDVPLRRDRRNAITRWQREP